MKRMVFTAFFWGSLVAFSFGQSGGLSFLKLGISGRAAGLGEAYTAVANDASATYWNPAGILLGSGPSLVLSHNEWIQDVRSEYIAFVVPGKMQGWGLSFNSANISGIELRGEQPSPEPISTFSAYELSFGTFYARKVRQNLTAGIGLKFLYEKIYIEEAGGLALDAGLLYSSSRWPLRVAFVVQNVGKMGRLGNESSALPLVFRSGFSFAPDRMIWGARWLLAADLSVEREGNVHTGWGVEVLPMPLLALRAGYQTGYETRGLQYGFGIRSRRFALDYGLTPFQQNLGLGQRLSITIYWQ